MFLALFRYYYVHRKRTKNIYTCACGTCFGGVGVVVEDEMGGAVVTEEDDFRITLLGGGTIKFAFPTLPLLPAPLVLPKK